MIALGVPGTTALSMEVGITILRGAHALCQEIRERQARARDEFLLGCWAIHYNCHRNYLAEDPAAHDGTKVKNVIVFRVLQAFFDHTGNWSAALAEIEAEIAVAEQEKYRLETIEGVRNA